MKTKRIFNLAKNASFLSDFNRIHIGCVIVYKNRVISVGYNTAKENPIQKVYNRERGYNVETAHNSLHAEMMALVRCRGVNIDWEKAIMCTYREYPDGSLAMSKPCKACMKALQHRGIKKIWYTGDNSYIKENLI